IVWAEQGVEKRTGTISLRDEQVNELIQYFNDFETHVRQDGVPVSVQLGVRDIYHCRNAPARPRIDLSNFQTVLKDAATLDDKIDELLSKVNYMDKDARRWNPWVTDTEIADKQTELLAVQRTLERAADDVAKHRVENPTLPISEGDLPKLPNHWVPR